MKLELPTVYCYASMHNAVACEEFQPATPSPGTYPNLTRLYGQATRFKDQRPLRVLSARKTNGKWAKK